LFRKSREFWLNLPIRVKGGAIIAILGLCLMMLVAWFTGMATYVREAEEWVVRTQEIREETEQLSGALLQAENGIRGYVITGSRQFLEAHARAADVVPKSLARVALLVRHNALQTRRLEEIDALALIKLRILHQQETLLVTGKPGTPDWVELGSLMLEGKARMEELRRRIDEFLAEEDRLLARRNEELERRRGLSRAIGWLSLAVGILGGMLAAWLFSSGITRRLKGLEQNARHLARQIPLAPAFSERDEMSSLDRELHTAARIIAEREARLREIVAELQRTEEAVEKLHAQKDLILNSAGEGIYGVDTDGKATFINPAAASMMGWEPCEIVGKSVHALTHHTRPDGSPYPVEDSAIFAALHDGAVGRRDDEYFWRKDGSSFPVEYTSAPQRHNGKIVAAVVICRDITERKRAEEDFRKAKQLAEEANRAKSDFLACMSHEIRTPLNAIIGIADLLRETELNNEQQLFVQTFQEAGVSLLTVINDILDLSKVESGHLMMESIDFDLHQTVDSVITFLAPRAHRKGLNLALRCGPKVSRSIRGDPQRLRQVLVNLISNAIKFTEKGEVSLTITLDPEHPGDPFFLRLAVQDTGPGVPPEKLGAIFDSFVQADTSTTRVYGGTGLGLAISRGLVQLMGGRIWAESDGQSGSTFYFTARFEAVKTVAQTEAIATAGPQNIRATAASYIADKRIEHSPAEVPALPKAQPVEKRKSMRILIAEDSQTNLFLIQSYLKSSAFDLDVAPNGAVALEKFQTGEYAVVLMDIQMPVMDGYTATRKIREWERDQHKRPTPVLALTAHALKEEREKTLAAGCNAHLTKPIRRATLLEAIEMYTGTPSDGAAQSKPAPVEKIRVRAPEGIEDAIPMYLDLARNELGNLADALRREDFAKVRFVGHDLKGTGGGYGFPEISAIGKCLEEAAKSGDAAEIEKKIADLASYLDRVEVVYS